MKDRSPERKRRKKKKKEYASDYNFFSSMIFYDFDMNEILPTLEENEKRCFVITRDKLKISFQSEQIGLSTIRESE